jgi:Tol biopolymer transport system component
VWHRLGFGLVPGLVLAGCGFRSSAASGGGSDGGPGDAAIDGPGSAAGDGSIAPPGCFGHWMDGSVAIDTETVKEVMELSSAGHDLEPWISNDGLRMYFSRDLTPPGHGDIYFASRSSPTGNFGTATAVTNLNSTGHEGRAWLTSDELTLALSTAHDGPLDIHMTTRGVGQPFGTPDNRHLAMVNAKGSMRFDPFVTDDLRRLYFSSDTGPSGKWQLWIAARSTPGDDFGTPSLVPGITDNSFNYFAPALYQDEQLVVFSSFANNATADLYYATRSSATGSFGTAVQIPKVNTSSSEIDPVLSQDGCELYFASDRDADHRFHLFRARIMPGS